MPDLKRVFLSYPAGRSRPARFAETVLAPVLREHGFELEAPDWASSAQHHHQTLTALSSVEAVVADLTGLPANVLYEVGVASGLGKQLVLVSETSHKLPMHFADYPMAVRGRYVSDDEDVAVRVARLLHSLPSPRPTPTEFYVAPARDYLILESASNSPATITLAAEVAAVVEQWEEMHRPVQLARVRSGSLLAWLGRVWGRQSSEERSQNGSLPKNPATLRPSIIARRRA